MKKRIIIIVGLVLLLAASILSLLALANAGFRETQIKLDGNYNELFTKDELDSKGHLAVIPEYSSDVSVGYTNMDGTKTLYVFAAPIRYLNSNGQLSMIDTRLANVKDPEMREQGYIYTVANSDIKSFFPKTLSVESGIKIQKTAEYEFGITSDVQVNPQYIKTQNFINEEKAMLTYNNAFGKQMHLQTYPTALGCNAEIVFNAKPESSTVSLWLKTLDSDIYIRKEPGGYLLLAKDTIGADGKNTQEILGVIQKPLLKYSDGKISYDNKLEVLPNGNGMYELKITLDDNCLSKDSTAFIAFEMRREKQPDNAIYSKLPDLEYTYLRNYSVIGNSDDYGIGRLLIRYKFAKTFSLQSSQIKEANYYAYNLNKRNEQFEMLSVLEDWCSLTGNWNDYYQTGDRTAFLLQSSQELKFNITGEVKKWCDDPDGQMEHNGLQLKTVMEKEGEYNILLSNDNSLYQNKTEIILK